ncbi:MAG: MobA/MobL family protein [Gammaproteobacteria bacterium]
MPRDDDGHYHLHVRWIGRLDKLTGKTRDVVAAAAYRSGTRLRNDTKGKASDFSHKAGRTLFSDIMVPPGSPNWAKDRAELWNTVEKVEKRKDSRLATEIEFAIPYGCPRSQWERVAQHMALLYVGDGHVVDFALHLGEDGANPHVHMLLPMRRLTEDGFARRKNREMDRRAFIDLARERWEIVANEWLEYAGSSERIDRRSYRERGLERTPGRHERPDPEARAIKRAIRHRQLEEQAMQRAPTMTERRIFPHLTQREEWPPKQLHPTPDMTKVEREELTQYRESLVLERELKLEPQPEQLLAEQEKIRSQLEKEQERDLKEIEFKRAREQPESNKERDLRRAARASGDLEEIERTEVQIMCDRIETERRGMKEHAVEGHYRQHLDRILDRVVSYTPEEQRRIGQAHDPKELMRTRADIFRSRLDQYEEYKRQENDTLRSRPDLQEDHDRLRGKALNQMFRTPYENERIKEAWELVSYTKDKRALRMVEDKIISERMDRIKSREEQKNRKREERERSRDNRENRERDNDRERKER